MYFFSHLKGFLQFILVEFRGSVAANVWAEAVESAVVNLLHQTKHFQGNLCALYFGFLWLDICESDEKEKSSWSYRTLAFLAISYPSWVSLHIRSMGKESWYSPRNTLGPQVSQRNELPADILIACQKSTTSIPLRLAENSMKWLPCYIAIWDQSIIIHTNQHRLCHGTDLEPTQHVGQHLRKS